MIGFFTQTSRLSHTNIKEGVNDKLSHTNIKEEVNDRLSHTNIKEGFHDTILSRKHQGGGL